ncbi:uncharacterized protein LOC121876290 [Homarus americanus]|uniref:RING finger protein 145-like 1 n=1 Tax=Homarus americanus TaxID=6706 RepID=A0A8J5JT28_HOMAM|nr:uncharacterized protein LOC121876290 [Homarus americanus]XP_042237270.1 uncharacterized protein LOC121876290 [Homarus americanus]KAG7160514.1 RING finger protein 145-like 1 [Homarus americanus]
MGVAKRVALRLYTAWQRRQQVAALPPILVQAAVSSGWRQRRPYPPKSRLCLIGVTLLVVLLLPWASLVSVQLTAHLLAGVGLVAALTASVLGLFKCLAEMDDHNILGGVRGEVSGSKWLVFIRRVLLRARCRFLSFESLYMKRKNFSILVNQLVFFSICERLLLTNQRLSSLYTLMFFNVAAYCVSYIKELVEREDWSMYINIARNSNVRHLALSTTKIVLEWTKAITFIITVVFMLLVFGLEKGLKNYSPTNGYLTITGIYFISTEKVFVDMFTLWLDNRKFDCFESMENFYCPAILISFQILLSSFITFLCIFTGNLRLAILCSFTNIRVKYRELSDGYIQPLQNELEALAGYRVATRSEVKDHDDVCAICLTPMTCARITPCQHFFHADCLRRCLKESNKCPICQYNILITSILRHS